MRMVTVDPITRLEGHGRIDLFLNDQGDVENAYYRIPELRGFEKFCEGRHVEELPRIVARICGVCPGTHHMASGKAVDKVFGMEPPSQVRKLRELFNSAHLVHSHIAHFYALAAPDFVVGPQADPAKRNILGLIEKVGLQTAGEVFKARAMAQKVQTIMCGRATHPVLNLPGGVCKPLNKEERDEIENMSLSLVEFAKLSLKIFEDVVLKNKQYVDLILSDGFTIKTYYMGLVDRNNKLNLYDGDIRVVDQTGKEFLKFKPEEYVNVIGEYVVPWTTLKMCFLKKVGWKGLVDGPESGMYRVAPLARLNAADGMTTPLAQAEYERYFKTLGGKPVHHTLAMHWARLVELLYGAEKMVELIRDPEIMSQDVRFTPTKVVGEGVGVVEAQRGTLYHHYWTDKNGIVEKVNIIVATANGYPAICLSIKKAAQALIKKQTKEIPEGLLNMVEMAFRAYDPCYSCSSHSMPGGGVPEVNIYDCEGSLVRQLKRD
jgi:F420-non-reducing hydrogenase large subunit